MDEAVTSDTSKSISRRDFLKLSGAGFTALVVGPKAIEIAGIITNKFGQKVEEESVRNSIREALRTVQENSRMIVNSSKRYGIPPEILSTVTAMEHIFLVTAPGNKEGSKLGLIQPENLQEISDAIESAADPEKAKIGWCQVGLSEAMDFEDKSFSIDGLSEVDIKSRRKMTAERLMSPWWNLAYFSEMLKKDISENGKDAGDMKNVLQASEAKYSEDPDKYEIYKELILTFSDFFKDKKPEENFKRCSLEKAVQVWKDHPEFSHLYGSVWPVEKFVVHHTSGKFHTESIIKAEHVAKGFGDIGYNGIIGNGELTEDGRFYEGRSPKKEGAHTLGFNRKSIGVALVGDFNITKPTEKQMDTLLNAVVACSEIYEIDVDNVVGHRQLNETECPGGNFDMRAFRRLIDESSDHPTGTWKTKN